jgi:hypothetical protein
MKTSENINEIAEALALAQGEIQNPAASTPNEFFKSKYADLAAILDIVRPAFSRQGLSVVQMPYRSEDGAVGVTTTISHKSGQWMQGSLELPLQQKKNIAQDAGSLITYLRRYALAAAAGVAQEDLDANLGSKKEENTGTVVNLKTISETQHSNLVDLIDATNTQTGLFCQAYGISELKELPSNKYQHAVGQLEKKLEKMEKTGESHG